MTKAGGTPASSPSPDGPLAQLAQLHHIQTAYRDAFGNTRCATPEALLAMLRALGVELESAAEAGEALEQGQREIADRLCEPVVVAWDREPWRVVLHGQGVADAVYRARLVHEDGSEVRVLEGRLDALPGHGTGGRQLVLDDELPPGQHRLLLEVAEEQAEIAVFRAPTRAWQPDSSGQWGLFAPTYGLRSARNRGCGDLRDLETLVEWTGSLGGQAVATLPLLAAFLDQPFDPSPYAPASRLFWNELYLDPERLPELQRSSAARARLSSADYRRRCARLRESQWIDYREQMRVQREVVEELARTFFEGSQEQELLERYLRAHPLAEDYARFRATLDRLRVPWQQWPARLRAGELCEGDYDEQDRRYHLYAQWRTSEQIERLGDKSRSLGLGLYLDLPLGVHAAAFDTWRMPELFLEGCSAGAPPDLLFTGGQSWGLAPLHPERARASAYSGFAEAVRNLLRCAGALRIDHVMGLHRLYCIPHGIDRHEGVYVGYRAQELYALLSIESHRHRSLLIGEDLGTVAPEVRESMEAHGIRRLHVLQYEIDDGGSVVQPGAGVCASVNTHDLPPFAGWCAGSDIAERRDLGLLSAEQAEQELALRLALVQSVRRGISERDDMKSPAGVLEILHALLLQYACSTADLLIVSLEDLWLELEPQNVPGTGAERRNWRRKLRHSLEEAVARPDLRATLGAIAQARRTHRT